MLPQSVRLGFLSFLLLLPVSCGPVQGYPGPELPLPQVALLRKVNDVDTATVDGQSFYERGITVLPGRHTIQGVRTVKGGGYNCTTRTEFDSYGYDSCRDRREEDIRNNKDPEECYRSSYETTVKECDHDFERHSCDAALTLLPGAEYLLSDNITGFAVNPMLFFRVGEKVPIAIPCKFESRWTSYLKD